ncbi:helix-turn-helix transcriptional regulator [Bengtsoniella intestinalis]|uniref:helix-turn-helix domain-containing protein n=1 Tax=Bengtsoniella intestinalis TaxID=3073143 RepID=UPI00391EEAE5
MTRTDEFSLFCHNVKHLRISNQLTQQEMAHIMGIGVNQLRRIERNDFPKRLGACALVNLSRHFHCSISSLFS